MLRRTSTWKQILLSSNELTVVEQVFFAGCDLLDKLNFPGSAGQVLHLKGKESFCFS